MEMKQSMRKTDKCGFTLVELLVVIAIIAVLMALLLPTAEYARFQAKCSHCMANLRNWGNATNLYAADHDGSLPRFDFYGGLIGLAWDRGGDFWKEGLADYGILPSMYFCPLDTTWRAKEMFIQPSGQDWWGHFSYVYWIGRTGPNVSGFQLQVDATGDGTLERPALHYGDPKHLPIMSDGVFYSGGSIGSMLGDNDYIEANADQANGHYFGGKFDNVNVVFLDGRVEVRKRNQIQRRRNEASWGATWW
jgi:prepilin-type N-terminal cleavage/methylation domain-containing protein